MYLFLINPEAGKKKFAKVEVRLTQLLKQLNIDYQFVIIDDLNDVEELMDKHIKPNITGVVAVGGNATVNTVINHLVGEELPLAIVPMSKTNYLAHSLGISRWDQAIKMLASPEVHSERLGKIGNQYFVGMIEVLSHANLLTRYVRKNSLFRKFLGIGRDDHDLDGEIETAIVVDEEMQISGPISRIEIKLNPDKDNRKLRLNITSAEKKEPQFTKLWANSITIECDRKMAVVMGNETVAQTPVEIKGLSKYIKLLVPNRAKLTQRKRI